jgi:hypothetical protein
MGSTVGMDGTSRLAGRALDAMLAIASTTPAPSIGDELRGTVARAARRVVIEAVLQSEERRRAERRRTIQRAVLATVVVAAALVAARHRASREDVE